MSSRIVVMFLLALGLVSCGKSTAPEKSGGHEDHGSAESGALFAEGKGITLMDETKKILGVELAEVASKVITPTAILPAQVYRASGEASRRNEGEQSGFAYATTTLDPADAALIKPGQAFSFTSDTAATRHEGTIWRVVKTQLPVTGKVELLLQLPDSDASLPVGAFLKANIPLGKSKEVVAIPHSAVLTTSQGTFAYVQNGKALMRTEVTLGSKDIDSTEITSGLYEGDTFVIKPVEKLYLIELRATKGGGHSH